MEINQYEDTYINQNKSEKIWSDETEILKISRNGIFWNLCEMESKTQLYNNPKGGNQTKWYIYTPKVIGLLSVIKFVVRYGFTQWVSTFLGFFLPYFCGKTSFLIYAPWFDELFQIREFLHQMFTFRFLHTYLWPLI